MNTEVVVAEASQARVDQEVARRVLDRVTGLPALDALARLKFAPATTCEPIARVVERALADAARRYPLPPEAFVVAGGEVAEGEPVIRVRRQAHGLATWITTRTTRITVQLTAPSAPTEGVVPE
jgi:ribosomal protein L22